MSKACQGWNYTSNHSADPDGRIILIWKSLVAVKVISSSRQSMTCEIEFPHCHKIYFTAVYASNSHDERQDLWVDLINTHQSLDLSNAPWVIGGGFNQITHPAEHSSMAVNCLTAPMISLRNVLNQLEVFDLRYAGPLHTWTNKSPSNPVAEKLDRLLANHEWISHYPNSLASFLPPNFSDHSPCLLDLHVPLPLAGTRPFKFFNYLTKHHKFNQTVVDAWNQAVVQVQALTNPTPDLFQQEKELYDKWCFLRLIEESYFKQKSRVNWLKEGDLNTTYFHRLVQVRASFNSIRFFMLPSGVILSDPITMGQHAVNYFQSILAPATMNVSTQSGLGVSLTKTCFFSCGLSQPEIDHIKQTSGLTHGTLLIRYLGVPLCTRKLSMANCEPLISSVKAKLTSWSAKTLSFAGRLLLINTVISGITNFWCTTFTLPKFCIKTINSLCGAYLWKGTIEGHHTARVSWDTNRCPTRDRLLGWGLPTDPLCLLCNVAPESRDHIYYQCPYSWSVWTRTANRAGYRPDQDWNREMINMQNLQGPRHLQIIRLLAWQCTLYYIWAERNSRLHRHIFKPPDSIVKQIEATIRSKISALRD
ncbi:unnamed protein product [Brassica oleracea]